MVDFVGQSGGIKKNIDWGDEVIARPNLDEIRLKSVAQPSTVRTNGLTWGSYFARRSR